MHPTRLRESWRDRGLETASTIPDQRKERDEEASRRKQARWLENDPTVEGKISKSSSINVKSNRRGAMLIYIGELWSLVETYNYLVIHGCIGQWRSLVYNTL